MKSAVLKSLSRTAEAFIELVYPKSCHLCHNSIEGNGHWPLCGDCYGSIIKSRPPFYGNPDRLTPYFDRLYYATLYKGTIRECIHRFKYSGNFAFEKLFADLMADFAEKYIDMKRLDHCIPVPLHRVKYRERTFNQAEILARHIAGHFGIAFADKAIVRRRYGRPQIELPKSMRKKETRGAFAVREAAKIGGKNVLLVDDIFTTGSTVNECSRILKKAGAKSVEVFTLARSI